MKLNDFLSVVSFSVVLRSELQTTHAFANNRMLIVLFSCKQQSIHSLLFCSVFDFHALGVVNKVQVFHCVFAPPGFEYNNFIWPCLGFRCLFVCVDSSAPQFKQKNTFVYSNFIWDAKKTHRSLHTHTDGANLRAISLHFKGFFNSIQFEWLA